MYRERGSGGSKMTEAAAVDRKRINEALDKHLERSSPSTSRAGINGKENSSSNKPLIMGGKSLLQSDHRETRSASLSKTNISHGLTFFFLQFNFFQFGFSIFNYFFRRIVLFETKSFWIGR